MNPQLTISILSILLLANSIATLVSWFWLRELKGLRKSNQELTNTVKYWQEIGSIRSEKIAELFKSNEALQSKLNAAKDALK